MDCADQTFFLGDPLGTFVPCWPISGGRIMGKPSSSGMTEAASSADAVMASRLEAIFARGSEHLLELQADSAAAVISGQILRLETTMATTNAVMTAIGQLPELYCTLFEQAAQHVLQSCLIVSQMNGEIIELFCDSVTAQAPVIASVIVGGNALVLDRRRTSVVVNFFDRRGMIAVEKAADRKRER